MIGYRYVRTEKTDWRLHHGSLIPLSMPNAVRPPSYWGALRLLIRYQAPFIRWEENFDDCNKTTWWHVIKDVPEELEHLSASTRSKVRRGQRNFTVMISVCDEIFADLYQVYQESFKRYKTFEKKLSFTEFKTSVQKLPPETEFWIVRDKVSNKIVAFSENIVRDDACLYNTIWFEPLALKKYSSYVLLHEMNKYYLNIRGMAYVSDGSRSINHQTNIHQFLEQSFGFRKAFSDLKIIYFPGFRLLIHLLSHLEGLISVPKSNFSKKLLVLIRQHQSSI
jgi:hypothetical protein